MPLVDVKVSYLQMLATTTREVPEPRPGLCVLHARRPPVHYYRYLYHAVGNDYHWYSRGRLEDAQLAAILQHPQVELHVLHVDGVPAGFAELDRRVECEVELVQFGLMGEHIGRGLGKWFLRWTIDRAWSGRPTRLWLHTCTLDHPAALPNYLKAGFTVYREEMIRRDV